MNNSQTLVSGPVVAFPSSSGATPEGDVGTTTYTIPVSITSPDEDEATTVEVVATSDGSATNADFTYTPQTVSFPVGTSTEQTVAVTIIGDTELEPDETILFELRNVSGGGGASIGSPSTFTLTLTNDEALPVPDLLITEFMANPDDVLDGEGEWFELFNASDEDIDLSGWTVTDDGSNSHTVGVSVVIPAGGFLALCANGDATENGGLSCDYEYSGFTLTNSGDEINLLDAQGTQVDRVAYGSGNPLSAPPAGVALVFTGEPSEDNNDPAFWAAAAVREASYDDERSDLGSPGTQGSQQQLVPVAEQALTIEGTPGTGNDAGWRMLASPVTGATRADLDGVTFSTSSGEMFYTWEGTAWAAGTSGTPLTSGRGFILYLFDDTIDPISPDLTLTLPGTPPDDDVAVGSLSEDDTWHLLGNPYAQSFDLSGLELVASGFQAVVQVWSPGANSYQTITESSETSDLLAPWQGFFVQRAAGSTTTSLTFDAEARTSGADLIGKQQGEAVASARRIGLRLTVFDEEGHEAARDEAATLYFSPAAESGWDAYDASKVDVPPGDVWAQLVLLGERSGQLVEKAQESRAFDPEPFEVELAVRAEGARGERELSWPVVEHVPDAWTLELVDRAASTTVDLRLADRYAFEPADYGGARFVLRVGAATTDVDEGALPEELVLEAPRPNPARTTARLSYALPAATEVRIVVYDVLGREVEVLAEAPRAAGRQEVIWHLPGQLAAGLYIVRLEAGEQVRTRRLVVVR